MRAARRARGPGPAASRRTPATTARRSMRSSTRPLSPTSASSTRDSRIVIPTLHARVGDVVYVHGSAASRTLRALSGGVPACLTVTLLDGLVLARSDLRAQRQLPVRGRLGHSSARLRSRRATPCARGVQRAAPAGPLGRRAASRRRGSSRRRRFSGCPLDEASAKVRTGPPDDGDSPDAALDVWAGVVPWSCEHWSRCRIRRCGLESRSPGYVRRLSAPTDAYSGATPRV